MVDEQDDSPGTYETLDETYHHSEVALVSQGDATLLPCCGADASRPAADDHPAALGFIPRSRAGSGGRSFEAAWKRTL